MSNQLNNEHLYTKWLNNELSDTELDLLKKSGDLAILEKIINETDSWTLPAPKNSYDALKLKIKEASNKKGKVINLFSYIKVAASIILLFGIGYFTHQRYFDITEYTTLTQETKNIVLPDGSTIILNSNSNLSFNNYNWLENRSVEVNGQAYFYIQKNKGEFKVDFTSGSVQVLGTQFDVFNYAQHTTINCYEGKIKTSLNNSEYILTKNMGIKFNGHTIEAIKVNSTTPTWTTNFTTFNNASLKEVLSTLSLKYGITYEFDKEEHANKMFTGQFVNNDLELALEMVFTPLSLNYNKSDSVIYISKK